MINLAALFHESLPLVEGEEPHRCLAEIEVAMMRGYIDAVCELHDFPAEGLFVLLQSKWSEIPGAITWQRACKLGEAFRPAFKDWIAREISEWTAVETRYFQTMNYGPRLCVIGCISRDRDDGFGYRYCAMARRREEWRTIAFVKLERELETVQKMQAYFEGDDGWCAKGGGEE
jgi:hypothetical protein